MNMTAPVIMVVGTASSVGKSSIVTGLCRIAARRGLRVAPFKSQNMSNNAAVTADGGEIARSIAVQAAAAQTEPTVHMNPILIKPEGDRRSQIIVEGKVWQTLEAIDYWQRKQLLWEVVTRNLDTLREQYDLVIAEGAGSPVELNLKPNDIVNMRVATYAQAATLLVGDIDVGGIFAALLGTLDLLEPEERSLVRGLIINRFRGDPDLFVDGVHILEERSGVPVFGMVPWINDLGIAEEDAVALERPQPKTDGDQLIIAVIQIPAIANFDDFDPLARETGVIVRYISDPRAIHDAAAVIIPGTKHTLAARRWLREKGFDQALQQYSGAVVGICGGYQLLGQQITDPLGVEGDGGIETGLNLLPIHTTFVRDKHTIQIEAQSRAPWGMDIPLRGYEIHAGRTTIATDVQPVLTITRRGTNECSANDGFISEDHRIWGCYIHGLFDNTAFRHAWLKTFGWTDVATSESITDPYDRLASIIEENCSIELLLQLMK